MNILSCKELLDAIKLDNLIAFSQLFNKDISNLSFGRFPILTICYLYNSKKIIKKYENELLKVDNYQIVDEPFVVYQQFRKVANRCLRLYATNDIVSPVEMLAILHKDYKVKKVFAKTNCNIKTKINLKKIYENIYLQKIQIENNKIKISKQKISIYQGKLYNYAILMCTCFVLLFSSIWIAQSFAFGDGIIKKAKICNEKQFNSALNNGTLNYVITNDIQLNDGINVKNFSGSIDGQGHTVYLKSNAKALFNNFNGKISNLTIIFDDFSINTSGESSLFAINNNGTIDNVNITASGSLTQQKNENQENIFTGLCVYNNGYIKNCNLDFCFNTTATGTGEAIISSIYKNNGTISNVVLAENSYIKATEVDIAGIVYINSENANVSSCKNYAELLQNSEIDGWSPTIGGIVNANEGTITNCINNGKITVTSTNATKNSNQLILVGGICSVNTAEIIHCLNRGELIVNSNTSKVYCGGISAQTTNKLVNNNVIFSQIQSCGNEAQISVTTTGENAYAFAGGISGLFEGNISRCFSITTFLNASENLRYYQGTCIGMCFASTINFGAQVYINEIYLTASDVYYLNQSNVQQSIGAFMNAYNTIFFNEGLNLQEIKSCETKQAIEDGGVYWYE